MIRLEKTELIRSKNTCIQKVGFVMRKYVVLLVGLTTVDDIIHAYWMYKVYTIK